MPRLLLLLALLVGCSRPTPPTLTVYCAHDAVYSQEILDRFSQQSGIKIRSVFDTEATKSLGLIERLQREADAPQCDVFWNNELLGTLALQEAGILAPYKGPGYERMPAQAKDPEGQWVGFGARMRVIIYNTKKLSEAPAHLDGELKRFAMAKPLYGTTLTHYSALWYQLGGQALQKLHTDRLARGMKVVNGNGAVKQAAAIGAIDWGWTDTDDYFLAAKAGAPVKAVPARLPDGKTITIPNTVALIRGAQNHEAAKQFIDFLLSEETELALAHGAAHQIPLGPVDTSKLPDMLQPWLRWARESADLAAIAPSRQDTVRWLKSL